LGDTPKPPAAACGDCTPLGSFVTASAPSVIASGCEAISVVPSVTSVTECSTARKLRDCFVEFPHYVRDMPRNDIGDTPMPPPVEDSTLARGESPLETGGDGVRRPTFRDRCPSSSAVLYSSLLAGRCKDGR